MASISGITVEDKANIGFKLISQSAYNALVDAGKVDPKIYYFVYPDPA